MTRSRRAGRRDKINATGRNEARTGSAERYIAFPRWLWLSPQISAASPNSRALLVDLISMHNGRNNGEIFLSVRDATGRLGMSDLNVALNAFEELQQLGLIEKTYQGFFEIKSGGKSRTSGWRLTWLGEDGERISAGEWRAVDTAALGPSSRKRLSRRQTVLKRYLKDIQQQKFAVADSSTVQARSIEVSKTKTSGGVQESSSEGPVVRERGASCWKQKSSTHILYHGDQGLSVEFIRADLSNFWSAAPEYERARLAAMARLDVPSIERAIATGDLKVEEWEAVRAALESRQNSSV